MVGSPPFSPLRCVPSFLSLEYFRTSSCRRLTSTCGHTHSRIGIFCKYNFLQGTILCGVIPPLPQVVARLSRYRPQSASAMHGSQSGTTLGTLYPVTCTPCVHRSIFSAVELGLVSSHAFTGLSCIVHDGRYCRYSRRCQQYALAEATRTTNEAKLG